MTNHYDNIIVNQTVDGGRWTMVHGLLSIVFRRATSWQINTI